MTILTVDDERLALDRLLTILKTLEPNSDVHDFTNPSNALSFLAQTPCDIAFLDIEMFGITGIELALRCKKLCPKINIIFVTGYSQYALDAINMHASGYILKPANEENVRRELVSLRNPVSAAEQKEYAHKQDSEESDSENKPSIRIQTFGTFEVFCEEKPLAISSAKAKELLAFLVDRRGAGATVRDIAAALWEDKEYTRSVKNQIQHLILYLLDVLKDNKIEKLIVRSWNSIAVDRTLFSCDYYDFLSGDVRAINAFQGEYMSNYSWAEFTTGFLEDSKHKV